MTRQRDTSGRLLRWYDHHRRELPWRAPPGRRAEPYRVWLSEIMLQQTTVAAVAPYYRHFLKRWPTIRELAAAELDEVLHAWQGLGYYARARNLHKCARAVSAEHGGRFPEDQAALLALPGIGPYTAAAIAAIAFDQVATPVDGNVERVVARLFAVAEPAPAGKPELRRLAATLTPVRRPGDHAQAMMDLGATICLPRGPLCDGCPLHDDCQAQKQGIAAQLPRRSPKRQRPTRHGVAFWLRDRDGRLLLRRRPEEGLLGGMMEVPGTPWREEPWGKDEAIAHAPATAEWREIAGTVSHVFTHFRLELTVRAAVTEEPIGKGGIWAMPAELGRYALPTAMKKVVRHALAAD
ncbi:MAG: A/G-specific adenine glycosylase [Alphaproteobacteria bacterium]|jgi:A/G-specific adenine glycosylase|nr:A/G-specific adenine glycosylase [Alphaproteobacteria bacterium]MDP6811632.1 A/G-specific adenine glycosylase [Alphaproteobacteria bacterium]